MHRRLRGVELRDHWLGKSTHSSVWSQAESVSLLSKFNIMESVRQLIRFHTKAYQLANGPPLGACQVAVTSVLTLRMVLLPL